MDQSEKLTFSELTYETQEWVKKKLREDNRALCEYTFASNYAWSPYFALRLARMGESGIFRYLGETHDLYSFPFGGSEEDKRALLEQILKLCEEEGETLELTPLAQTDFDCLRRWYPGQFLMAANRDKSDYIYEREKLVKLPGKKYHGKRNHIARFMDAGDWCYEAVTDENRADAQAMMEEWKRRRIEEWNVELEQEFGAMTTALVDMERLGLVGGLLRKAGAVVALAIGEPLNADTFVVHYEKAYSDVQGAYPMINQQFAEHAADGFTYINREEDTGDPGLRKAKLSYKPCRLEKKYTAIRSEVVFAHPNDAQTVKAVCELWRTCFDDGDFSEFYMKERATEDIMLVIYRDGRPVSMASFLPAVYHTAKGAIPVRYVYAVATLPEYRRQGLAEKILTCGSSLWDEPLVLCPADEHLYRYYGKIGFVNGFRSEDAGARITPAKRCCWNFHLEEADPEGYADVRERHLAAGNHAFLSWDAQAVAFAFAVNAREGGRNLFFVPESTPEKKELLMYVTQGETLVIIETTLSEEVLSQLLPELLAETGTTHVRYEIHGGMILLPQRLAGFEVSADGYLNLTLNE